MREVLATLGMTVLVFTFILLLGSVLKEVLPLIVSQNASLWLIVKAIALLLPFVLAFALPMGMLAACLLVFGRFSADHELTAARANGISLIALVTPVLLIGALMSGVGGLMNLQIAPQCRVAFKRLLPRLAVENPMLLLTEGRYIKDFPGYVIYVGKKSGASQLRDVRICHLNTNGIADTRIWADHGEIVAEPANKRLVLNLFEVQTFNFFGDRWVPQSSQEVNLPLDFESAGRGEEEIKVSDKTFLQLCDELEDYRRRGVDLTPLQVQLHRQIAFSFASIGFTLIGIPLGIRAHRRETSLGVALAIVLVLVYYAFIILGQALETRPDLHPQWILWIPNFLFQLVGAALLWRANRAG